MVAEGRVLGLPWPSLRGQPPDLPPGLGLLLGVLDKQPADEVLGQLAGVAEVLLVEVVIHRRDVGQGFLLGFTQEWGRTTQAVRQTWGSTPCACSTTKPLPGLPPRSATPTTGPAEEGRHRALGHRTHPHSPENLPSQSLANQRA